MKDRLELFTQMIMGASKTIQRIKAKNMKKYGLTSTHTVCLRLLYENSNGLTKGEISDNCEIDKAQITRIISELIKKGYVKTDNVERTYKRKFFLTEQGHKITDEINRIVSEVNQYVSGEISQTDIERFYYVFEMINKKLKDAEEVF